MMNSIACFILQEKSGDPIDVYNKWCLRSGYRITDMELSIWLLNCIKKIMNCNSANLKLICNIK